MDDSFVLVVDVEQVLDPAALVDTSVEEVEELLPVEQETTPDDSFVPPVLSEGEMQAQEQGPLCLGNGIYVVFEGETVEQGVANLVTNLGEDWAEALIMGATNQGEGTWHIACGGGGFAPGEVL